MLMALHSFRAAVWKLCVVEEIVLLIAYLDESYTRAFYFIGAAIAEESAWNDLEERYADIRQKTSGLHGVPADAEFHGHEIMGGKGEWGSLRGKHREAAGLYAAVLQANREVGIQYIFRGLDVARLNARYSYPQPPHTVVLGHLLERINEYARSQTPDTKAIVVADEIATQEQHQEQFRAYQQVGTGGYRSSRLEHISSPINFANSRFSTGLQAVDMATYIHRRAATPGMEQNSKAEAVTKRLTGLIYPSTRHQAIWYP